MTQATTNSTVTWCGTARRSLTDVEKAILFHEHEAKRNRFFGNMKQSEIHSNWIETIKKGQV